MLPPLSSLEGVLLILELVLLVMVILNYHRFKKYGLSIVMPLVIIAFIVDIVIYNLNLHKIYSNYNTLEIISLICGFRFLNSLKKYHFELITVLILLYLVTNLTAGIYQSKRMHNNHLWNTYYLLATPICHAWFFRILQLKRNWAKIYLVLSTISIVALVCDFITSDHLRSEINLFTVIIFNLQNIILSGLVIIRIIGSQASDKLHLEPSFWVLNGLIINGLINAVEDSMHSYLVTNQDQLRHFYFLIILSDLSRNFLDFCLFLSILLCVRKNRLENETIKNKSSLQD